jgi:hypothetical protein
VATLSQLLVWLQQGPALLRLPELAAEVGSAAAGGDAATADGSTHSSSSSGGSNNTSSAADASSSSSSNGGGEYGNLWFSCTSGKLPHALTAIDSCLLVLLC